MDKLDERWNEIVQYLNKPVPPILEGHPDTRYAIVIHNPTGNHISPFYDITIISKQINSWCKRHNIPVSKLVPAQILLREIKQELKKDRMNYDRALLRGPKEVDDNQSHYAKYRKNKKKTTAINIQEEPDDTDCC